MMATFSAADPAALTGAPEYWSVPVAVPVKTTVPGASVAYVQVNAWDAPLASVTGPAGDGPDWYSTKAVPDVTNNAGRTAEAALPVLLTVRTTWTTRPVAVVEGVTVTLAPRMAGLIRSVPDMA